MPVFSDIFRLGGEELNPGMPWPLYFDRQGFPIPGDGSSPPSVVWGRMFEDRDYRIVRQDLLLDGSMLSTVWLGLDHSWGLRTPLIFETMYFKEPGDGGSELPFPDPRDGNEETGTLRYSNEEEARATHERIFQLLKKSQLH